MPSDEAVPPLIAPERGRRGRCEPPVEGTSPSPCRRSRNSRTATSQPIAPTASSRLPRSGRPRRPSARRVTGPSRPSAWIPFARWNARSALFVRGPRTPSMGPGSKPCARSPTCKAAVRALAASAWWPPAKTPSNSVAPKTARRHMDRSLSHSARALLPRRESAHALGTIRPLPSPVAQLAEHPAVNRRVVGSSPTRGVSAPLAMRVSLTYAGQAWRNRPRNACGARSVLGPDLRKTAAWWTVLQVTGATKGATHVGGSDSLRLGRLSRHRRRGVSARRGLDGLRPEEAHHSQTCPE